MRLQFIQIKLTELLKHDDIHVIISSASYPDRRVIKASVMLRIGNIGKVDTSSVSFYVGSGQDVILLSREYYEDDDQIPSPVASSFLESNNKLRALLAAKGIQYSMFDRNPVAG